MIPSMYQQLEDLQGAIASIDTGPTEADRREALARRSAAAKARFEQDLFREIKPKWEVGEHKTAEQFRATFKRSTISEAVRHLDRLEQGGFIKRDGQIVGPTKRLVTIWLRVR